MTKKTPRQPWHPSDYQIADIYAVKALAAGTASDVQQKRAWDWILFNVCELREMSFNADNPRVQDFAEGKKFVARQMVKMMNLEVNTKKP